MVLRIVFKEFMVMFCPNGAWCSSNMPYQSFAWLKFMRCHITLQASCLILGWANSGSILEIELFWTWFGLSSQVDALQPNGNNWHLCQQSSSDKVKEQLIMYMYIYPYTSCYAKHAFEAACSMVDSFFLICHLCTRIWSLFVPHLWGTILVQFGFPLSQKTLDW